MNIKTDDRHWVSEDIKAFDPLTLMSDDEIRKALGNISRSTLWRLRQSDPEFPPAIRITPGLNRTSRRRFAAYLGKRQSQADALAA